jgi:hypothetical protein
MDWLKQIWMKLKQPEIAGAVVAIAMEIPGDTIFIYPSPSALASSFSNLDSKAFPPIR